MMRITYEELKHPKGKKLKGVKPEREKKILEFLETGNRFQILFSRYVFTHLDRQVVAVAKYKFLQSLLEVTNSETIDTEDCILVIANSYAYDLDFGWLFVRGGKAGSYVCKALWPKEFFDMCVEDPEIFKFSIYKMLHVPEFFRDIKVCVKPGTKLTKKVYIPAEQAAPKPSIGAPTAAVQASASVPFSEDPVDMVYKEGQTPTAAITGYEVVDGRCPKCQNLLEEARLDFIARGRDTTCPYCLTPLKGKELYPRDPRYAQIEGLIEQGQLQLGDEQIPQALATFQNGLALARQVGDTHIITLIDRLIQDTQMKAGRQNIELEEMNAQKLVTAHQYREAFTKFQGVLELAKQSGDQMKISQINQKLTSIANQVVMEELAKFTDQAEDLFSRGQFAEAIPLFEKALTLLRQARLSPELQQAKISRIESRIQSARERMTKTGLESRIRFAEEQFGRGNYSEARMAFQECLNAARQSNDQFYVVKMQNRIADCDNRLRQKDLQTKLNEANALFSQQQYQQAIPVYQQALQMARNVGANDMVTQVENAIFQCQSAPQRAQLAALIEQGNTLFQQRQYSQARQIYQQAIQIAQQIRDQDTVNRLMDQIKLTESGQF